MESKHKSLGIAWFLGPLDRVCSQHTGQDCLDPSKVVDQGFASLTGGRKRRYRIAVMLLMSLLAITFFDSERVEAQPTLVDPRLDVRTVVSGLNMPTTMAFLGDDDILVLEKETGRVRRVMNGVITSTVLDLAVNFGSEMKG